MLPDKSVLLERINTAIKKNWTQKSPDLFDFRFNKDYFHTSERQNGKNHDRPNIKTAPSVEKLEQRIESLEGQNNDLFYFINFLIEKLPDLVMNILCSERETLSLAGIKGAETPGNLKHCCIEKGTHPYPTPREKDVLDLLEKGLCAKEIANRLFISETTVVTHKKNLKEKFNARNTVELISKVQHFLSEEKNK